MVTAQSKEQALSKVTRPDAKGVWRRTRLFKLVDAARACRVVWISASAGSGKTTLASSYLESRKSRSLWYQVDRGDTDIVSFFYYLGLAAGAFPSSPSRRPLPRLMPDRLAGLETFARTYVRELYSRLGRRGMLVLDNYHEAGGEPLDTVIHIAAAELPAGMNLIVVSRFPPPASLSGLIINGAIAQLDERQLALDADEAAGIARHLDAAATQDAIRRWSETAQGWVAGLVLAVKAGSKLDPDRESADVKSLLFDYFSAEIMSRVPAPEREILLRAPFLRTMTANGLAQLTGASESGALLERLQSQNYFTSRRLDGYQFHRLFRDYLLSEADRRLSPEVRDDVRLRAARISLEEGRLEDAVELLIEAQAWEELSRLLPSQARATLREGRLQTLERWLAALPAEWGAANPWLRFWYGVCRLPHEPDRARREFESCLALFERSGDQVGFAASWSKAIESVLHECRDMSAADASLALVDRVVSDEMLAQLPDRLRIEVVQNALVSLLWRQPDHPRLPELEARTRTLLQTCTDADQRTTCNVYLCLYYCWRGMYPKVRTSLRTIGFAVRDSRMELPMMAAAKAMECLALWRVEAEFDRCLREVEGALQLCEESGVHLWDTNFIGQAAGAALSKGDLETGGAMLERMRQRLPKSRWLDIAQYHTLASWHAWARGDATLAREHAKSSLETFSAMGFPWGIALSHAGCAFTLSADDPEAERHAALALREARRQQSSENEYVAILARLAQVLDRDAAGEAPALLARLFALGREHTIVNCFYWSPALMSRLCAEALAAGIETEYATQLIRRRDLVPSDPERAPPNWPWRVTIQTLGGFKVRLGDRPLAIAGKGPARPLALLQLLIAYGGTDVSERKVTDVLWPDSEGDAALRALDTTLARLRRLLQDGDAVLLANKRLSLDPARVWVDAIAFRQLCERARAAEGAAAATLYRRAIELYRGPFLDDEDNAAVEAMRGRLQGEFVQALKALGELCEDAGDWQQAIRHYEHGLSIDRLAESFYQRLMIAYLHLRRPAEGLAVYQSCRQALFSVLAVLPSAETDAIRETLRQLLP